MAASCATCCLSPVCIYARLPCIPGEIRLSGPASLGTGQSVPDTALLRNARARAAVTDNKDVTAAVVIFNGAVSQPTRAVSTSLFTSGIFKRPKNQTYSFKTGHRHATVFS